MLHYYSLFVLLCCTSVLSNTNKTTNLIVQSTRDAVVYLSKFGYNPCSDSTGFQCSFDLKSILKIFQERFRLKITGILDDATKQEMSRSRCGNKDPPLSFSTNIARPLGLKWSRSTLTWSLRNYSPRIGAAESQSIIQQAFDAWSQHIPLDVKRVCSTCSANIVIDFGYGDHGDGYHFDGPSGTLAHAYYPEDGRIHFDMDEPWTNR
ncbi:unnamed protein product [Rotaria sp. Silwood2]|nr:unnamed protein product [Rotaria sp. Silwood2]CAF2755752.1 unnamed protein product [Rotaria sp. Silwood2]CAF3152653.1 unnamed protein product [Rotaria sp. Silwood2]CAF3892260.1 unnamed protein product [Rotaria sp. Silwood2]CAF3981768.1 unnamed protein product [Rotaria sp. Silwood2]